MLLLDDVGQKSLYHYIMNFEIFNEYSTNFFARRMLKKLTDPSIGQLVNIADQWVSSSMAMNKPAMTHELPLIFLASPQKMLMTT